MTARGSYPKGQQKREEILDVALEVFAQEGYRGTSLRSVARQCGLTVAGVMHYFDSREDLLTQVVVRRDRASAESVNLHEMPEALVEVSRTNASQPGLVELFVSLTAAARDREHPAHLVLANRYHRLRTQITSAIMDLQESGAITNTAEPEDLARLVIAVADGAQLQWMVDDNARLDGPLATLLYDILGLPPR